MAGSIFLIPVLRFTRARAASAAGPSGSGTFALLTAPKPGLGVKAEGLVLP